VPQSRKQPQLYSRVVESLWDNPSFVQAGFHISWFVIAEIDTEADRDNIKVLYSNLESTSAQIDVSA
jgi:hypothetical protein